ncbi:MAG: hypothetical protein ACE5JL_15220, partial [Dehalococcoidia bacterium]
ISIATPDYPRFIRWIIDENKPIHDRARWGPLARRTLRNMSPVSQPHPMADFVSHSRPPARRIKVVGCGIKVDPSPR